MADIVDLNSRRPLPKPSEVAETFETIREWVQNGHARSYAVVIITDDGQMIPSHYAASDVDRVVLDPFLSIYAQTDE